MCLVVAALALLASAASAAPAPVNQPSRLDPRWQERTRALLKEVIEIPSVAYRGQVPKVAEALARPLREAGIPEQDIHYLPYEGRPGDRTVALLVHWRALKPAKKPMLVIGHMDVVEAKREEWKFDPFVLREEGGYFYGRGTYDMKNALVAQVLAVAKLKQAGFMPNRDIILFFTGDEETAQNGALKGTTEWRSRLDAEFALNGDSAGGGYDATGRPLGFGLGAAEKVYQTYFLTVRNRGGHSSRPRTDNAIYELADALKRLEGHSFKPELNPTTRAYFTERQKVETGPLGVAMRRWLSDEGNREAADIVEASEVDVGQTRTSCVATMLKAGHAENALAQTATATVNCRIMPGTEPPAVQAELRRLMGSKIEIEPDPSFTGRSTPVFPLRTDVVSAFATAVRANHGPNAAVVPLMNTWASDSSFFRAAGIPTYDADGSWAILPEDDRTHGLDERIPVRAMYDDVLHWEMMLRELAGR